MQGVWGNISITSHLCIFTSTATSSTTTMTGTAASTTHKSVLLSILSASVACASSKLFIFSLPTDFISYTHRYTSVSTWCTRKTTSVHSFTECLSQSDSAVQCQCRDYVMTTDRWSVETSRLVDGHYNGQSRVTLSIHACISDGFHTLQSMRRERIFAIGSVRWIPTKHSHAPLPSIALV